MAKFRMNKKTKNIIATVLSCVLIFGALFGIITLITNSTNAKTKTVSPSYSVGSLTADGKYQEDEGSIYTKDSFLCNGLKTTLTFDNQISYQIFFYDFDDNYLSATDVLTENYFETVPLQAKSARIVITPNEDDEITFFEISKYAKQLGIEVSKKQYEDFEKKQNVIEIIGYSEFDWQPSFGYWNCEGVGVNGYYRSSLTDSSSTDLTNKYVGSSVRFSKSDLPNGTIIRIASGWKYRPEKFSSLTGGFDGGRADEVTTSVVVIDDAWWNGAEYVAFNVCLTTPSDLTDRYEEACAALVIEVPNYEVK